MFIVLILDPSFQDTHCTLDQVSQIIDQPEFQSLRENLDLHMGNHAESYFRPASHSRAESHSNISSKGTKTDRLLLTNQRHHYNSKHYQKRNVQHQRGNDECLTEGASRSVVESTSDSFSGEIDNRRKQRGEKFTRKQSRRLESQVNASEVVENETLVSVCFRCYFRHDSY